MKIFCIGRNYAAHAAEMGSKVPTEPLIFMKPPSAILTNNKPLYYPEFTNDLHYEGELVFRICKNGKHVDKVFAPSYIDAVAFGIDFTARDLQSKFKEKGQPWELAKGFDNSAALSEFIPIKEFERTKDISFTLHKNGISVQQGSTAQMIFDIPSIISYVSRFIKVQTGDYIFSGTPVGVGPVKVGDVLTGYIEDRELLQCEIR